MRIAIYDKGRGPVGRIAANAAATVCGHGTEVEDLSASTTVSDAVSRLRTFTHIVCHLRNDVDLQGEPYDPSWRKLVAGNLASVEVIIRISSDGAPGMSDSFSAPYRHNETGPWILHMIESFRGMTEERWTALFTALKNWDATEVALSPDMLKIFAPRHEARQALRLLCEAWHETEGGTKTISYGPITVRAPKEPSHWFDPFGEASDDKAPGRLARQLGITTAIRHGIENVLGKVVSKQLNWPDPEVDSLRKALSESAR